MAYLFLKSAHENNGRYYAIDEEKIKTLNVSEGYDNYGQRTSYSDAGDHLEILTERAALEANSLYNAQDNDDEGSFRVGDIVSAYDNSGLFTGLYDSFEGSNEIHTYQEVFNGFNFWDGNNWKTVVTSCDNGEITHEIEEDEAIIARLNTAIENKEWVRNGFGTKEYIYMDAEITYSQYQAAWEEYTITLDNETV